MTVPKGGGLHVMRQKIYCDECDTEIESDVEVGYADPGMTLCVFCFDDLDSKGYVNSPKYTKSFPNRFTK
jgi:hypothetical protein